MTFWPSQIWISAHKLPSKSPTYLPYVGAWFTDSPFGIGIALLLGIGYVGP